MKKTIAQELNVKEFPFRIKDSNGNVIYYEDSNKFWSKTEYDTNGNEIYYEESNGYWIKYQYDSNNKNIYYENSIGEIVDNRPKEVILSMDEIANKFGIDIKDLKVKK